MNVHLKTLVTLTLVLALAAGHAQTAAPAPSSSKKSTTHKRTVRRNAVPPQPSVENQLRELRQDMQVQIDQLKQQLVRRDEQLQQAQQAATAAQAAAEQARQQAAQQTSAVTQNAQTVSNLQGAVSDLQTNSASLATTIQAEQSKVQKAIENPDAIRFKGITLSPTGSYLAAETVYRSQATGGGINTSFTGIPIGAAPQTQYSEFYGSGRQSRVAMFAEGKVSDNLALHGYYEADWLSSGTTSNNNQSNSYTLRQRQLWAQAHWGSMTFTGGQMWSLATETAKGLQNRSEILPSTIDAQYEAGFVWARQYGFRVTKDFGNKVFFGASLENPQILNVVGHNLPTNFVIGQTGTNGGLYNLTTDYASNVAPDVIAKLAFEPGWGHYEIFGIGRFFRARVYPNDTGSAPTSAGAYNDTVTGGGIGGSLRVPTFAKHLDVGLKGLYGDGTGRYGGSTIADMTVHPDGTPALLHNFSALSTLEFHATPRLDIYANYGGDYVGRRYFLGAAGKPQSGYGAYTNIETGCETEPDPGTTAPSPGPFAGSGFIPGSLANCTADTKDVQEFTVGYWYNFYSGPAGRLRQGLQYSYIERNIWSGVGPTPDGADNMFFTSLRYYLP